MYNILSTLDLSLSSKCPKYEDFFASYHVDGEETHKLIGRLDGEEKTCMHLNTYILIRFFRCYTIHADIHSAVSPIDSRHAIRHLFGFGLTTRSLYARY